VAGLTAVRRVTAGPAPIVAALVVAALVAWLVTIERMAGMDSGPGTDLGGLGWFVGVWATMMAAMMVPATTPVVVLFARVSRPGRTAAFVAGDLLVWVAFGLAAYALYRVLDALDPALLDWDGAGRYVAGGAVVAAGIYQLTPLKAVCLRNCRSPLQLFFARSRPGPAGAIRMGAEHGAWCTGCCWALMLVLFAVGVMSLFWMVVVAAAVFAEKALPGGTRAGRALAAALVVLGVWIALAPGSVPNLTEPTAREMPAAGM
jgi:predicted metal-binding membrane protein